MLVRQLSWTVTCAAHSRGLESEFLTNLPHGHRRGHGSSTVIFNHSDALESIQKPVKSQSTRRPRNPVAKAVRTPLYKMRVVESKRRKLLEKWTEAVRRGAKDVKGGSDER